MWRELISQLAADEEPIYGLDPGPTFSDGATLEELAAVEKHLGRSLPADLSELLSETNGVLVTFGVQLIWNTDELVKYNHPDDDSAWPFRPLHCPDDLFFFGDIDGEPFAFASGPDGSPEEHVYIAFSGYNDLEWRADTLRGYVEGWLTGKLSA